MSNLINPAVADQNSNPAHTTPLTKVRLAKEMGLALEAYTASLGLDMFVDMLAAECKRISGCPIGSTGHSFSYCAALAVFKAARRERERQAREAKAAQVAR